MLLGIGRGVAATSGRSLKRQRLRMQHQRRRSMQKKFLAGPISRRPIDTITHLHTMPGIAQHMEDGLIETKTAWEKEGC